MQTAKECASIRDLGADYEYTDEFGYDYHIKEITANVRAKFKCMLRGFELRDRHYFFAFILCMLDPTHSTAQNLVCIQAVSN